MSTPSSAALASARGKSTGLRSITISHPHGAGHSNLLDLVVRNDIHTWIRRGEGLVAFGETARFTTTGPARFDAAQQWWKQELDRIEIVNELGWPGTGPVAFGSFAFSKTSSHESRLIVPEILVGSRNGHSWITYITADPGADLTAEAAESMLEEYLAAPAPERVGHPEDRLEPGVLSEEEYMRAVRLGVERIHGGTLSKLVLARDVVACLGSPVAAGQVLRELAVRYQDCWTYAVDGLIGSTPEMLIKVEDHTAQARVLAGTLDRAGEPLADPEYAQRVLAGSEKQLHEHQIAIDSLTGQLEPFTHSMTSHSEPFVLKLPNVWHLASDVCAELAPDEDGQVPTSLALVGALHPTAAVCGTPTTVAGSLIRELEHLERGPYAGPVGWIDANGNGEWGIALRGGVIESETRVRLYAGCGIVEGSQPEAELAETWSKLRPMMEALGVGRPEHQHRC